MRANERYKAGLSLEKTVSRASGRLQLQAGLTFSQRVAAGTIWRLPPSRLRERETVPRRR